MCENPTATTNPFDLAPFEEETELRTLTNALQLAEGFTLLFARCNQPDQRRRLMEEIKSKLPNLKIKEIHFDQPIIHLLRELREEIDGTTPDAVFVSGLEYSLPKASEAHATPFVANLNASRNSFSQVVRCPLVLWVPEYVLTAIARGAPDFFSVRSGVYYFAVTPSHTAGSVGRLTSGEAWEADNLPLEEKLERIDTIRDLLNDYEALPPAQRDRRIEFRLLTRLGNLLLSLRRWSEAETQHLKALHLAQEDQDRENEGVTLNNLGNVYYNQGRRDEAIRAYEGALDLCRESKDRVTKGQILNNLGLVYDRQGRWEEAVWAYEGALDLCRESGDRVTEGRTLNNLGMVYDSQEQWEEAVRAYDAALEIKREFGDRLGEGQTLNNMGSVYYSQGRWEEAVWAYEGALAIFQEFGDRVGQGMTLFNLALLWRDRNDLRRASGLAQSSLAIFETTEDHEATQRAQSLLSQLEALKETEAALPDRAE